MTQLLLGDLLKDNDPRMGGRVLMVTSILPNGCIAVDTMGRKRAYLSKRIFLDGKERKYGFNVLLDKRLGAKP